MQHRPLTALEDGLAEIRSSPKDAGTVELIACRPAEDERELLAQAELDPEFGVVGDSWHARPTGSTEDGSAHPDRQLTVMNARAAAVVAGARERWALAGDQLYVDLDLSVANLPPGTRLELGSAVIEVTAEPHLGCGKFARRFGTDALRFVNSQVGRELNLRGVNARVVTGGRVETGKTIRRAAGR